MRFEWVEVRKVDGKVVVQKATRKVDSRTGKKTTVRETIYESENASEALQYAIDHIASVISIRKGTYVIDTPIHISGCTWLRGDKNDEKAGGE
ncbi:hypothetical protein J7L00_03975 [Candidatus Bathyarchaeota archaeon]|nr:hypothetical protein [Candidatus Bathyarchaeota archaeon]